METNEMWRLPQVMKVTGLSKPSVYRFVKKGNFPKQYRLGERAVAWRSDEIKKWIETRVAA